MELMQFNYFMAHGVLSYDAKSAKLAVHEEKFHDAVASMLGDVLEIQAAGDVNKAEAYIAKWGDWKPELHERLAEAMRATETSRFPCITFDLLDAPGQAPRGAGRSASAQ